MLFLLTLLRCIEENFDQLVEPWYSALDVCKAYLEESNEQAPYRISGILYYEDSEFKFVFKLLVAMKQSFVSAEAQLFTPDLLDIETNSTVSEYFAQVFCWVENLLNKIEDPFFSIGAMDVVPHVSLVENFASGGNFTKMFFGKYCQVIDNCMNSLNSLMHIRNMLEHIQKIKIIEFRRDHRCIVFNLNFKTYELKTTFGKLFVKVLKNLAKKYNFSTLKAVFVNTKNSLLSGTDENLVATWNFAKYYENKGADAGLSSRIIKYKYKWKNIDILHYKIMNNIFYCIVKKWDGQVGDVERVKKLYHFPSKSSYQINLNYLSGVFTQQIFVWDEMGSTNIPSEHTYVLLLQKHSVGLFNHFIYQVPKSTGALDLTSYQNDKFACLNEENKNFGKFLMLNIERTFFYKYIYLTRSYVTCGYFWDKDQESFSPNNRGMRMYDFDKYTWNLEHTINALKSKYESAESLYKLKFRFFDYDLNGLPAGPNNIHLRMINVKRIYNPEDSYLLNKFVIWFKFINQVGYNECFKVIHCPNRKYLNEILTNYKEAVNEYVVDVEKYRLLDGNKVLVKAILDEIDDWDIYNQMYGRFEINYKLVVTMFRQQIIQKISSHTNSFTKKFYDLYKPSTTFRGLFFHPLLNPEFAEVLQSPFYKQLYAMFSEKVSDACDPTKHKLSQQNILLVEQPTAALIDLHQDLLQAFINIETYQ